jgi:flagellar M-ring protein FliF
MTAMEHAERLWAGLLNLGTRRLIALGVVGVAVFAMTGLGGYFLSRPSQEILYSNLDRQDIGRIATTLKEAGISFDVNSDGNTVLVHYGETARARMLLAEKGLPNSPNAGNELFDKLGSLGLTSFMQEVTRVRALEGELARTIQLMRGVKAARVHLVMPDEGSFRRSRQPPSASVVVRTESNDDMGSSRAIRHLVASSIPGMTVDQVTVLNTDGVLLSDGGDSADAAPGRMLTLEKTVSKQIGENIRKTLTPYLGLRNFQISVATQLNTDKRQTNETIFNPDSKVERSVKTMKQNSVSQNASSQPPATVDQNIPQQQARSDDGKTSNDENSKREETTNYELSSKTVTTVSDGFAIGNISVAVLVNKTALAASLGPNATPEMVDKQIEQLKAIVASAAGASEGRGDNIRVAAVDFVDAGHDLEPTPGAPWSEVLLHQTGTMVNALTILVVAGLVIFFAVRPATRALLGNGAGGASDLDLPPLAADMSSLQLPLGDGLDGPGFAPMSMPESMVEPNLIEDLTSQPRRSPQKRLEQIVEFDEGQAAAILKQWMQQGEEW